VEPGIEPVVLDGAKLKQILYNLLSNAVKFSPDGSTVRITAGIVPVEESPLELDSLEIRVSDRGIGIAEADQQRIFEDFQQVDSSTTRSYVGTGLGLALVRRLTELQQGMVTVESEPGVGSTFRVLLPTDLSRLGVGRRKRGFIETGGRERAEARPHPGST
jgi:signal transduction histidine kinase